VTGEVLPNATRQYVEIIDREQHARENKQMPVFAIDFILDL